MPTYKPFDWYATPLYYDIIFDQDTDRETDFLEAVHHQHGQTRGKQVLEPACGSGRLITSLASRGWKATGIDLSEPMLTFAKQRLSSEHLKARLLRAPMQDFRVPGQFDLAHCLVSSFKYLADENQAADCLRCVCDHLKVGGLFVLGLHLSDYDQNKLQRERWVDERAGVHVICNIQSWPADARTRTERVRSRLIVTENKQETRYETTWDFRTYDLRQLQSLLACEPRLELVATYNFHHDIDQPINFDGSWYDNVLILRKKS